jgi:hypothetical protein
MSSRRIRSCHCRLSCRRASRVFVPSSVWRCRCCVPCILQGGRSKVSYSRSKIWHILTLRQPWTLPAYLKSFERTNPSSNRYAHFEVADFLLKVKTAQPKPKWYQVLADALVEPNITIAQYIAKIAGGSKLEIMVNTGKRSCEMNDPSSDDTEDDDEHYIGSCKIGGSNISGSTTSSGSSPLLPDDETSWEFVRGTNLGNALLHRSDPSKFFLIRQRVGNPQQKDIFHYPQWETFDWNNPESIRHLNEARQIRARTKSYNPIESMSSVSPASTSAPKATPTTLKLISSPKSTATSKTAERDHIISPFSTPVPIRGKKRKMC